MEKVDLFYQRGRTQRIWLIFEAVFAIGFSIAFIVSVVSGWSLSNIWFFGLFAVLFTLSVPSTRKKLADDKAKISLTSHGIEDHRMRTPTVLPWKNIVTLYQDTGEGHRAVFKVANIDPRDFHGPGTARHVLSGHRITVELSDIAIKPGEFKALVMRFAPHVTKSCDVSP